MICPEKYFKLLHSNGIEFFVGVPDSSLKNFTSYITDHVSKENNIIAANEGACIGLASGYHLATEKTALVYMQNSGLGNAANPLISLADEKVYQIPMLLMIGWRGEPGIKDEPQHAKQGEITLALLDCMNIPYTILDDAYDIACEQTLKLLSEVQKKSTPHALIIRPKVFEKYTFQNAASNDFEMPREEALKLVVDTFEDSDIVVSTTGKLSRELFEYRQSLNQKHDKDFLTVGSMGHSASIALGIALKKPTRKVYCLDGDGSVLMHSGSLSTIGTQSPDNLIHIVFNNGAHESVGGLSTVGFDIDFTTVAKGFNYKSNLQVSTKKQLIEVLSKIDELPKPLFIEVRVGINSRENLGRPTISPVKNKENFIQNLKSN